MYNHLMKTKKKSVKWHYYWKVAENHMVLNTFTPFEKDMDKTITSDIFPFWNMSECKGRHRRESKNAKQMRNTKQNCFWHSSASPRNNKQCSAKQCFANQTNMCLADFASRSDLFLDNEHGIVEKLISDTSFWKPCTYMWLEIDCWLALSYMLR